jgi:pimeloyl-ACP methyl ester carboxylesterase
MATFVLIPGAGGMAWYWHRVVPLLQAAGHEAVAVDLPGDDPEAGLATYADRVVGAIGARKVILVAQSLGGFTAPLVCERVSVQMLVFVNAMIPVPNEIIGEWGEHTGATAARKEMARREGYSEKFDETVYFFHDLPPDVLEEGKSKERPEAEEIFQESCQFTRWPSVPTHVIASRDDRLFPLEFQQRVARERLNLPVDEVSGGHLVALSNPSGLVRLMFKYL